jgi:phospholipid/cholesterol/gamma-HCH transport system permease protein
VRWLSKIFEFVGKVGLFSLPVLVDAVRSPFEFAQLGRQLVEVGNKSLALIIVSGFALGAVMTLHTRSTLVMFGATAMIPAAQAVSFFDTSRTVESPGLLPTPGYNRRSTWIYPRSRKR